MQVDNLGKVDAGRQTSRIKFDSKLPLHIHQL